MTTMKGLPTPWSAYLPGLCRLVAAVAAGGLRPGLLSVGQAVNYAPSLRCLLTRVLRQKLYRAAAETSRLGSIIVDGAYGGCTQVDVRVSGERLGRLAKDCSSHILLNKGSLQGSPQRLVPKSARIPSLTGAGTASLRKCRGTASDRRRHSLAEILVEAQPIHNNSLNSSKFGLRPFKHFASSSQVCAENPYCIHDAGLEKNIG